MVGLYSNFIASEIPFEKDYLLRCFEFIPNF